MLDNAVLRVQGLTFTHQFMTNSLKESLRLPNASNLEILWIKTLIKAPWLARNKWTESCHTLTMVKRMAPSYLREVTDTERKVSMLSQQFSQVLQTIWELPNSKYSAQSCQFWSMTAWMTLLIEPTGVTTDWELGWSAITCKRFWKLKRDSKPALFTSTVGTSSNQLSPSEAIKILALEENWEKKVSEIIWKPRPPLSREIDF